MSWLFSQALVAAYSEATCSDGEQSAPSSGHHTQQAYLSPDKMTAFSRLSRFGMTFRPLTADRGEALLTSYLAAFPVRTSQQQERVQGSTANGQDSGSTWQELSVRYDLSTSSWRTHQCLFSEDLPWSSVTLPRWGMMRSGVLCQHPTAERPISGTESGLWPTPCASEARQGYQNRNRGKKGSQISLSTVIQGGPADKVGGALNPTWVEWLMGWPLGWTDLKPLEMDKFRQWPQQHGAQ